MKEPAIKLDHQVIDALSLHSSFIDNPGLLNGKWVFSFSSIYLLACKTGNPIYDDYAGGLIDEVYEGINPNTH